LDWLVKKGEAMSISFILWLHNVLCQLIWGGDIPGWLLRLHERFGWLVT
jgi:hypothetical protein